MTKATDRDMDLFAAVMGAALKGVPMQEAVTKITGQPDEWDGLLDRVIESFADLELVP